MTINNIWFVFGAIFEVNESEEKERERWIQKDMYLYKKLSLI